MKRFFLLALSLIVVAAISTAAAPSPNTANVLRVLAAMPHRMAHGAECDQIFFRIIDAPTTKFLVMNLQVHPAAAVLAFQPSRRSTCCRSCS